MVIGNPMISVGTRMFGLAQNAVVHAGSESDHFHEKSLPWFREWRLEKL
jgi:hypothetical protein